MYYIYVGITQVLTVHCLTEFPFVVQVLGWDANGTIVFNDMFCTVNTADRNGGCLYASGRVIVNDGTAMAGNVALLGGSIRERYMLY